MRRAEYCKTLLRTLVSNFSEIYDENSVIINVHNSIHITDEVINTDGSLFQYSSFAFGDYIGFKKRKLVHSTYDPVGQISKRLLKLQNSEIQSIQRRYHLVFKIQKKSSFPECII